jgi:hypothetical protein
MNRITSEGGARLSIWGAVEVIHSDCSAVRIWIEGVNWGGRDGRDPNVFACRVFQGPLLL